MATQIETNIQTPKSFHFIRGYPFVGNLPDFTKDRLGLFQRMARAGHIYGMHFGPFPGILFNKPEHVQSILVEHAYDFDKGIAIHNTFRPAIGDGIFSSEYAFVPFGAGPRICIGLYFAMMEGHLLLATLAQRVNFSLVPGQTIMPDPVHHLALRPGGTVNVIVKKR